VIILIFLRKRVKLVVEKFVEPLPVDLVRPPAKSIRSIVIYYDHWLSSQIGETQAFF